MKALMLGGILAAVLSIGLAPAPAEAGHRHSRHCAHRSSYSSSYRHYPAPVPYAYGYSNPYAGYGSYGHRHDSHCGHRAPVYGYGYGLGYGYGYGYAPAPPAYVVVPPPLFRCVRPRVSIHVGF